MPRKVPLATPGEILLHDFLEPMGITQYRLAKEIGVPQRRIGEIVAGRRSITADTALRLAAFFGTDAQSWINLQSHYDTEMARDAMEETLSRIRRWDELSAA
ncbi:MAG: HigA family addiction module antitoxin [Rhodocyclales bacterium]|jgi:addiction module HigA family antidote|nr:MAG: plasmid maintenance system antidote protein [Rhodocyclaceae bacterium]MCX7165255.1 HigA family addiction module antitoxin [Rhodocyclales bacterium]MDP2823064.1 HigA family addiction module antitoxin [Sulfuritalea sp.]TND03021.1 MAG: plasmid maintenance system antidote protein [Rhodocyclaceae bacterium]